MKIYYWSVGIKLKNNDLRTKKLRQKRRINRKNETKKEPEKYLKIYKYIR